MPASCPSEEIRLVLQTGAPGITTCLFPRQGANIDNGATGRADINSRQFGHQLPEFTNFMQEYRLRGAAPPMGIDFIPLVTGDR
jgi:hypothetical protein